MSYDEERQRKSRVVVETPTARHEEHYVQTRRVPERNGVSTGTVAAVALTAIALTALVVFFLMNRGTDATQTNVNISAAATPFPTAQPPLVITQPTPMMQPTAPAPIIVQAPPAQQPAPVIVSPPASGTTAPSNPAGDDATVESRVNKTFSDDADLGTLGITVTVINGRATLNGLVKSDAQKARAEQLAKTVRGVRAVDNKIIVEGQ